MFLTVFANVYLLFYVARSDLTLRSNQLLGAHIVGILGWSIFILVILWLPHITKDAVYAAGDIGYKIEQLIFLFATLWIVANFWFIKTYTRDTFGGKPLIYILTLFQLWIFFALLVPDTFFSQVRIHTEGYALLVMEPLSLLYSLFLLIHLSLPLFMLVRSTYRELNHLKKTQYGILLVIYSIFFLASLLFNWLLPVYLGISAFNALGPTISLILVAGIVYAITYHEFLDIAAFVQRGVIFTVLLVSIITVYLLVIHVVSYIFGSFADITLLISAACVTVLGIFSVPHIDRFLKRKTDKYFFKDKYNYSEALFTLSETINKNLSLNDIITHTQETLAMLFKVDNVSITSMQNTNANIPTPITNDDFYSVSIPIVLNEKHIGSIFLDQKRSGDRYTKEDISLLKTFAYNVAVAFEKARLYKEVEDYSRKLEKRVKERTAKIKKLQEHQRQMMFDISHKLQNPLTVMHAELHLLKRQTDRENVYTTFERAIEEISAFIYDLLRLSRLESGFELLNRTNFNFSDVLKETLEYHEMSITAHGITLDVRIAQKVLLYGDKEKMQELITNLLSNAVKYIGNGGARKKKELTLSLSKTPDHIELVVADTGVGIDASELPHIFDRFYRVSQEANGQIAGTGLGLAIAKQIVEMHDGSILAESTRNVGTSIRVRLPI